MAVLVCLLVAIVGVYTAGYQIEGSSGKLRAGPVALPAQRTGEAADVGKHESQTITPDAAKKTGSRFDPTESC